MCAQSGVFAELSDCLGQRGRGNSVRGLEEVCLRLRRPDDVYVGLESGHNGC